MPVATVNDVAYYYEIIGEGPPLVLIPGFSVDHTIWSPIQKQLAKHFRVVVFDNRGCGRTVDQGETLSAELMARDIIRLAEKLGLENPHIVGQSMGGTIAQALASEFPDRIGKLILLVTTLKWRKPVLLGNKSLLSMMEAGANIDHVIESKAAWVYSCKFLQNSSVLEGLKLKIKSNPYPQSLHNLRRQYAVLESFDGHDKAPLIDAETLVVCGTEDIIALPEEARRLASKIKKAKLAVCDCAHGIVLEIPQVLSQLMIEFLTHSDSGSR